MKTSSADYVIRVHSDLQELPLDAWNALLAAQAEATPFMRLEYLQALQESGSATAATGWQAQFLSIWQGERLMAACPAYLKIHSYGEYVFDWAWADAYQRHGLDYYPKLLVAVPFTPVPGARLLAADELARRLLLDALLTLARQQSLSSAHILFSNEAEHATASAGGWMARSGVQFHWSNRLEAPYRDFEDFLASLQREKRKKIQQEQRKVREAGVSFETRQGKEIQETDWDFFYRCYQLTYRAHHSQPYLTRDFFRLMAQRMPGHWLLFIARREGQAVAASLIALDPEQRVAYGRYWGATEPISCLHFEACYYQPLRWCIAQGYRRFEGGAQGEHKMARGLMPVSTGSSHWLAHPDFSQAVAEFLGREGQAMHAYVNELESHQPFKPS
ncbi:GNAT family N-acetyltransferase [Paucibacter sp. DJ2R-2]|uniref:GNAT family N-acetyltransferase n=1 Tax=Paucibacter sp. DJ2R-2 TaxID=2893558 RepID=UPI0021E3B11A|nr:GNAT family N-acetyltransferase [Paucibacter sp. DJ2R-2]MCV2423571.1 GNAT family N-acetyltransferase [Paucibacter sp. DJ4R-1]MCV2441426.1 GNAT family N-acetyltransferase [Paucibacter sp. DJ2R-2]